MSRAACRGLRAALLASAGFFTTGVWANPCWVILEDGKGEGTPELIQVVKEEKGAGAKGKVLLQEADGKSEEVEASRILVRIPTYPPAGTTVDREEAVRIINLLLEAKNKAPSLEKALQEQVEQWKGLIEKIPSPQDPEALARAEEDFVRAVARARPQPHDPATSYTMEQLEGQIEALEKLKREFPARTVEIDELMDPWKTEVRCLKEGKRKFEGRWLLPEEWEREREARERAAKEAFLRTIRPPEVSPVLIGQGTVLIALAGGTAGLFLGISFIFHGLLEVMRRRAWWKGGAWLASGILVVGLMARATGMVLATPEPREGETRGNDSSVENLLWSATGQKKPYPREIQVEDRDLNSWWVQKLRPGPLSVLEILVVGAESWRIQFFDGGLRLEREGRLLGRPLVLRQEMTLCRTDKGEEIYRIEGYLGKMPLPPAVVLRSWKKWMEDVAKLAEFFSVPKGIRLERLEKGRAVFSNP